MAIASCASTYIARFFNMQRMLPGFTTLLSFCMDAAGIVQLADA